MKECAIEGHSLPLFDNYCLKAAGREDRLKIGKATFLRIQMAYTESKGKNMFVKELFITSHNDAV